MRQILFLSMFLASCNQFPTITPKERCFTLLDTESTTNDGVDTYFKGVCQCQMYEWTKGHIGKIGEPTTKPLLYCDKFAGYSPDSTGKIYAWQESIRLFLNRQNTPNQ
jgi:hypothetical protein